MSIDVTSFDDLSESQVEASKAILRQMLAEEHPDLDFSDGTVNQQIILQPNAEIAASQQEFVDRLMQSNSLEVVTDNPSDADDDTFDLLASNYLITRNAGTAATGVLTIAVSNQTPFTVSPTTTFTSGSRTFNPQYDYNVYTTETLVTASTDKLLRQRYDGKWWVSIDVVESVVGGAVISADSEFNMSPQVPGLYEVYAPADFIEGTAAETNAALIARINQGTAIHALAGRTSIEAAIQDEYPALSDSSIIGFGDDESIRDARNVLGINSGGKADLYLRTARVPQRLKVTVIGTYAGVQELLTAYGVTGYFRNYGVTIDIAALAGFYQVTRVTYFNPAAVTSQDAFDYEFIKGSHITGFTEAALRGIRHVDEIFSPVIVDPIEATYSRYQGAANATISNDLPTHNYLMAFDDLLDGYDRNERVPVVYGSDQLVSMTVGELIDMIDNSNGQLRVYDVYLDIMPSLVDIQDWLNDRDNRTPGTDYLAKAPMPCFVSVTMTVYYDSTGTAPVTADIQNAAANAVNSLQFTDGSLSSTDIITGVRTVLPAGAYVSLPITMTGVLRRPDGVEVVLSGQNNLDIPNFSTVATTRRTTAYLLRPDAVTVTLVAA